MSKSYGMMCSYESAIAWAEQQPESTVRDCVLARMRYERDKAIPVKPKFHPGKYGHRYDSYTCGNCGTTIAQIWHNYCPKCGFAIGWDSTRCLTGVHDDPHS